MIEPSTRLESSVRFILGKAGVAEAFIDPCVEWAFGKDAWYIPPAQWPGRWNRLHPQAFSAHKDDKFVEFIFVVGTYYVQERARFSLRQIQN